MIQISGDFFRQGRREWRFRFKKNVGVFLVSFGVGGVRGLPVVCLRRGVVIVGLLCVWVRMATVRGAEPATHRLGVVGTFLSWVRWASTVRMLPPFVGPVGYPGWGPMWFHRCRSCRLAPWLPYYRRVCVVGLTGFEPVTPQPPVSGTNTIARVPYS